MSKKLLLSSMIAMALVGCNNDDPNDGNNGGETIPPTDILPPTEVIPPTDIIPPTKYRGTLQSSSLNVKGDVICNDQKLNNGNFEVMQGESFNCSFGSIDLGLFEAPFPEVPEVDSYKRSDLTPAIFNIEDYHGANATKVLKSINSCESDSDVLCLEEINSFEIEGVFSDIKNNDVVDAYFESKKEESTDNVGEAPSSHVDNEIVPETSTGTSNDLNNSFVSADAESTYEYEATGDSKVLTIGRLVDENGKPLIGINFFSKNSTGVTDNDGSFEYLWGDELTFSIETFEIGSLKGNKIDYKITDVSDNQIVKSNIQSLIERYALDNGDSLEIDSNIKNVFETYPNVINEIININLPNGGIIEGSEFSAPNEFEKQFESGIAKEIDILLKQNNTRAFLSNYMVIKQDNAGYVTTALNKMFENVDSFHVFNDNSSFYGASGYTRGMRALNLSNNAFPVVMPRTDLNKELGFGESQAWTREGKPYIAAYTDIEMPEVPKVDSETVTYGFPFVTVGEMNKGSVVFMGNGMYPSILSCPENYWGDGALNVNSNEKTCSLSSSADFTRSDNGSMKQFFDNLFVWLVPEMKNSQIVVGTNITKTTSARAGHSTGKPFDFFINDSYGFSDVQTFDYNGFTGIDPKQVPLLILQGYEQKEHGDGMTMRYVADLENPKLSTEDITALIQYVNDGGKIVFMEAIDFEVNPEPIGKLADAVGVSVGGYNVTPTNQAFCGSSYYCQAPSPNLHVKSQYDMVVLERYPDVDGKPPFTVNPDGSVTWVPPALMTNLEIPTYQIEKKDENGNVVVDQTTGEPVMINKYARIFVKNESERLEAIKELQTAFEGVKLCTHEYEYEVNCIEDRKGHGKTIRGAYHRKDYERYPISPEVVKSMIKAANIGTNIKAMFEHELYYRSRGTQGTRLSVNELNQTYDNLSVWLWNDNQYFYDGSHHHDELGFKTFVEYLNCYTDDKHDGGLTCPETLKTSLVENGMIYGFDSGELKGNLNPSYPLNYMEKPLTRLMLGRSFWDYDITVDTTGYPGKPDSSTGSASVEIETTGKGVSFSAGNNQSTGLWIPQLETVTVSGGVNALLTVMFADDLTGLAQHEKSLKRPPRMQMSFEHNGTTDIKVPYGGLLYIKPLENNGSTATFSVNGAIKGAYWKDGGWIVSPEDTDVPIAEIDTGDFVYTTSLNSVKGTNIEEFNKGMNRFANAASDFYGRDEITEDGIHRRFTYEELKGFKHRFVQDVQISIGAAHSGYPVMSSSFNKDASTISTNPYNDWLLWHEVGHNLAANPFKVAGGTEVVNNILALYMQELEGRNENPQMDRVIFDIKKTPMWLSQNDGHAWSLGDAGIRLLMFAQLKIWAEDNFDISNWYEVDNTPSIFNNDQGWNLFKLMHRKSRGDTIGDTGLNYCDARATGLSDADHLMVCASYASGYDLSDFFISWNPGEVASTNTDGTKNFSGGITQRGLSMMTTLDLPKPKENPLSINKLPN